MTAIKTPTDYFNSVEEPRRTWLKTLHGIIRKEAPKLKPFVLHTKNGDIVGYGKYSYETKSGCKGEWFSVGLSNKKGFVSLYVVAIKDGKYLPELYKKNIPKCKIGKSCINIKKIEDIDLDVVRSLIQDTAKSGPPDWA